MNLLLNKKAFTLIELLVVIAIVGILSGMIVVSMNGSINSANDVKRKAGVDTIRKALIIYGTLNGMVYPSSVGWCNIGALAGNNPCSFSTSFLELLPNFPQDPISGHYYKYNSDGIRFTVSTTLSNSNLYSYSSLSGFAQIFTVGTTTWTPPSGCNSIEIEMLGGGGGGSTGNGQWAGGGGGAGYLKVNFPVSATSYNVTVGAKGLGQTICDNLNTSGTVGGNSTFSTLSANGGGRGTQPPTAGIGGSFTTTGATSVIATGSGTNGNAAMGDYSGGGGNNGGGVTFGAGAVGVPNYTPGNHAIGNGNGGGGGHSCQGGHRGGGNGSDGAVIIRCK